jgi:hypothetical protein
MSAAALAARALLEAEEAFFVGLAVADDSIAAAAAMARAYAAGVQMILRQGGRVRLEAAVPPPQDVVEELRRCREAVVRFLEQAPSLPAARLRFRVRGGGF